jgi:hypothetical protein
METDIYFVPLPLDGCHFDTVLIRICQKTAVKAYFFPVENLAAVSRIIFALRQQESDQTGQKQDAGKLFKSRDVPKTVALRE